MSSAAGRAAAKAARLSEPSSAPSTAAPSERATKVRSTVDLYAPRHRAVNQWQLDAADTLGRAEVTRQAVLAGLVELLLTDETTSRKLLATLKVQGR